MLAPSCTQARKISASRSRVSARAAGSSAATFMGASRFGRTRLSAPRAARSQRSGSTPQPAKAVACASDGRSLDDQFQNAVREIKMMFETKTWRKRIVDACAGRQFARQKLAVEAERRRRDRPAAEAAGRIDPFRLLILPDKRGRVAIDIGKQAGDGCAVRSSEAPEHGGCRAHFAVLDSRQGGAAHSALCGKLIERPAPRADDSPGRQGRPARSTRWSARTRRHFHIKPVMT